MYNNNTLYISKSKANEVIETDTHQDFSRRETAQETSIPTVAHLTICHGRPRNSPKRFTYLRWQCFYKTN